jgi:hypothetical protein
LCTLKVAGDVVGKVPLTVWLSVFVVIIEVATFQIVVVIVVVVVVVVKVVTGFGPLWR